MHARPVTTDYLVEKDPKDPTRYLVIRRSKRGDQTFHKPVVGYHDNHIAESTAATLRSAIDHENGRV